ncbi:MAG TPA: helix-turn-helix domain-containing protein, partial [Methylomirabilota bacterium]|nr:helix-turn-helix domain-containing protein [Methylomirabilota bacterium]
LSKGDRDYLRTFRKSGGHNLREFNRATVLIFLDKGLTISEIENLLEIDRTTIWRIRKRFLEHGLEVALTEDNRSGQPAKYSVLHEAELTALACGPVPKGRRRWTIRLLVRELNKQKEFETITYGSVRKLLKKTNLSLG